MFSVVKYLCQMKFQKCKCWALIFNSSSALNPGYHYLNSEKEKEKYSNTFAGSKIKKKQISTQIILQMNTYQ